MTDTTHKHVTKLEDKAKQTREEQAAVELGHTTFSRGVQSALVALFLLTIFSLPVLQHIVEIRKNIAAGRERVLPQIYDVFGLLPSFRQIAAVRSGSDAFALLPQEPEIRKYENALDREALVTQLLLPPTQEFMTRWLGLGNEKAFVGRAGWLFYRPDMEYLTGAPFLDPRQLAKRAAAGDEFTAAPQPDPVKAVLQFRDQLAKRGIKLIVMPAPVKGMVHPEKFAGAYEAGAGVVNNPSFADFKSRLEKEGVAVFDVSSALAARKQRTGQAQYLMSDTHWRPEAMEFAAGQLRDLITNAVALPPVKSPGYRREPVKVSNTGDVAVMMKLPAGQTLYPPEEVTVQQVVSGGGEGLRQWRADPGADVLLLGDSFCNIFSLAAMGWGEAGGFAEQLSYELQRPLDAIVRNDAGAFATREMLSQELARGRDRLAGKKLVIWEFAARELASGDWRLASTPMELGQARSSRLLSVPAGRTVRVTGTVQNVSPTPQPGTVPYQDHIAYLHLTDLVDVQGRQLDGGDAVVAMFSMRKQVWTPVARYRIGDRVELVLANYDEVDRREKVSSFKSTLLGNDDDMETACWGEPAIGAVR